MINLLDTKNLHQLLFDEECELCKSLSKFLLKVRISKQLNIISLQSHILSNKSIPIDQLLTEIHLVSENRVFKGHFALIETTKFLSGVRYFYYFLNLYPISQIIKLLYFMMKKYRKSSKACNAK
ncbi:MAG: hypothetical protein COB02_13605 [Candidatus Cloacimonadota bacterium]|nr:MAG: hypothetical protein COB02_13605 [Candidatus Cloacimonadota bacterium]